MSRVSIPFIQTSLKMSDNETTTNPKESEDSQDQLPSEEPEESKKDSTTIFQG